MARFDFISRLCLRPSIIGAASRAAAGRSKNDPVATSTRAGESQKYDLARRVAPFVLVLAIQALIAGFSLNAFSVVRAYVGGESLWSKGQKDAIYFLHLYVDEGDDSYYPKFLEAISAPLGDLAARRAMEESPPDRGQAFQGFRRGGLHPDDIPGMIWLFLHFRSAPYLNESVARWRDTDRFLLEIAALGERAHAERMGQAGSTDVAFLKAQIDRLNEQLTPLTTAFSDSLGAGSRALKITLTLANVLTALLMAALIAWRIRILVAQRREFENALRSEKERAQITLQSIGDAVIRVNATGHVDYLNPAAERLLGVSGAQAQGAALGALASIVHEESGFEKTELVDAVLGGMNVQVSPETVLFLHSASGVTPISLVGTRIETEQRTAGAVLVLHDMTREQEYIGRLSWQARHDALTGLANRRAFEYRLEKTLEELAGHKRENALMLLDLDQFKIVNDTCGHAAGDKLLRDISALLEKDLRDGDLVARLGGDEFGILLLDCSIAQAALIAERLRAAIQKSIFVWGGRSFNVSASIGLIAISTPHASMEETLRTADIACYMAKEKGRNRVQFHEPSDSELQQRVGEMAWVQRIRDALEDNRFCLYAQRIESVTGDDRGEHIELLLRLRDESGELIPPNSFLPAAERFDLMPLIDRWVVGEAFACLSQRQTQSSAPPPATCGINLSAASIGDPAFTDFLHEQFSRHDIEPSRICFEITETGAIANLQTAADFIISFQLLGCRFALDDFGAGMSSFGYLKSLPVDYLKIDGGFVRDMLTDRIDRAMVEMVVHMAKATGKQTVAEYVESAELLDALRDIGVDYAQGYAIGRPEKFSENYSRRVQEPAPAEISSHAGACRRTTRRAG